MPGCPLVPGIETGQVSRCVQHVFLCLQVSPPPGATLGWPVLFTRPGWLRFFPMGTARYGLISSSRLTSLCVHSWVIFFFACKSMRRFFACPPAVASVGVCAVSRDRGQHARRWTGEQSEWRHTNHQFIHVCQKKTEKHPSHLESPTA